MSPAEIWSRLSDRALDAWERSEAARPARPLAQRLVPSVLQIVGDTSFDRGLLAWRRAHAPRLLPSLQNLELTREAFLKQFPSHLAPAIAAAEDVASHRIRFFGQTFAFGPEIDWHADPVSQKLWPLQYRTDIPVASGVDGPGDVKDVWELNRHQFLVDLAKGWLLTRDRRYAEAAYRLVDSWIGANPYGIGVNWTGPLEPAYRALSWLWTYYLCADDPQFPPDFHTRWMQSFHDHGRFLHRHLERFSSPYNHLIGEATALFLLGHACPELRESADWRRRGRHTLEENLAAQFYDDGGTVEQATLYHHATLGFYLLADLVAEAQGEPLHGVRDRVERAIAFAMHVSQPDGDMPMIGDTDDARPIRFEERRMWDFRHFQAAGAVLFGRGDFKERAGDWAEDAFWLLGPGAFETFAAVKPEPPADRFTLLRSSGYAVLRTSWSPGADYVCFDCGEQAGGLRTDNIANAAHGHADALSVIVCLAGRPVLVDSGFFTYNGERSWERFYRETAAHNTVRVDERDQAGHLDKMAWIHAARVTIDHWQARPDGAVVVASHDGYARSSQPVWHRRSIVMTEWGYVVIRDELIGSGPHRADVVFQCAPGRADLGQGVLTLDERFSLAWSSSAPLEPRLACGGEGPDAGWIAPGLSQRVAAPRLVLTGGWQEPGLTVLSIVADQHRVEVRPGEVPLQFVVTGKSFEHIVHASRPSAAAAPVRLQVESRAQREPWLSLVLPPIGRPAASGDSSEER